MNHNSTVDEQVAVFRALEREGLYAENPGSSPVKRRKRPYKYRSQVGRAYRRKLKGSEEGGPR